MRRQKKKPSPVQKQTQKENIYAPTIVSLLLFLMLIIATVSIFISLPAKTKRKQTRVRIAIPTPTLIPALPPVNLSLANTWKTYTNAEYGFTVIYPALGLNEEGYLVSCGNGIQDFTKQDTTTDEITPTINIDNFFSITLHPFGAELKDYVLQHDTQAYKKYILVHTHIQNADEVVLFYSNPTATNSATGYFAHTLSLYKKQNIIFQLDEDPTPQRGCQMVFDPRSNQQQVFPNQLIKNPQQFLTLLYMQYKSWNEAQSIRFSGVLKPTGQD